MSRQDVSDRENDRPEEGGPRRSEGRRAAGLARPACPVCGGRLVEIRMKLQCAHCRTICETCCEGGPG